MRTSPELEEFIVEITNQMAFTLVEMSIERRGGRGVKINLVLHKRGGISLNDLTRAQKVLRPRLEIEFDREDLTVEISSPGLSRVMKHPREYEIFRGNRVKLLHERRWINGTLKGADKWNVVVTSENGELAIPIEQIRKAKLCGWQ